MIVGTQRSGSNLLRLMLNQYAEIDAPHPPHIMQVFSPLIDFYKFKYKNYFFKHLVSDVCSYVNVNPVIWQNFHADSDIVLAHCRNQSLVEIFRVIYSLKALQTGARFWCCKSMANVHFLPIFKNENLNPFIIHLVRDVRNVVASFKNTIVGDKHAYFIAKQWCVEQEAAFNYCTKLDKGQYIILKYEELIEAPQLAIETLLSRLDLPWRDLVMDYYNSSEAKATAAAGEMWRNVINPIDITKVKSYKSTLSDDEVEIIESVAKNTMMKFGYSVDTDASMSFSQEKVQEYSKENDSLKKEARQKYIADASSRAKQEQLLQSIYSKLGYSGR